MLKKNTSKIFYIGFYSDNKSYTEERLSIPASVDKMRYIATSLHRAGYELEIVSLGWSKRKRWGYYPLRKTNVDSIDITFIPSFSSSISFFSILSVIFSYVYIFIFLIRRIKKNDQILCYHSIIISWLVSLAKKIKKFRFILEVEEIYSNVFQVNRYLRKKEIKGIEAADSYILANDNLANLLGIKKKYLVAYGVYNSDYTEPCYHIDGRIHIVYAGIIDSLKGGAFNALQSARYLDSKYYLHILGFGKDNDINKLITEISNIQKYTTCKIDYKGKIVGAEYKEFIRSCHIGLSTQNSNGIYLSYTFPSKILSYLSLGLRVVSADIDVVKNSKIGNLLFYYDTDNPKEIAATIKKIKLNENYNSVALIQKLDSDFISSLNHIFSKKLF